MSSLTYCKTIRKEFVLITMFTTKQLMRFQRHRKHLSPSQTFQNCQGLLKQHWIVACSLIGSSNSAFFTEKHSIYADFDVRGAKVEANPKSTWVRSKPLYKFEHGNDVYARYIGTRGFASLSTDIIPVHECTSSSTIIPPSELYSNLSSKINTCLPVLNCTTVNFNIGSFRKQRLS